MLTHSRLYVHVFQQAGLRKPFTYNLPKRYALENFYCENFQGCIVVYLSRFCFVVAVFLRDSLLRISHAFRFVNNFFKIFFPLCKLFCVVDFHNITAPCFLSTPDCDFAQKKKSQFLKILFCIGKKRRKRDLNPRAAQTTYTLSRGASSAS